MNPTQLLRAAYADMERALDRLIGEKELTADKVKAVRDIHDRAGCRLLELEPRLRGVPEPKRG